MRKMRISVNYADPHRRILSDAMNIAIKSSILDIAFLHEAFWLAFLISVISSYMYIT